ADYSDSTSRWASPSIRATSRVNSERTWVSYGRSSRSWLPEESLRKCVYKLRAELRWTSKRRRVGAQFTVRHGFRFFYVLLVGFWRSTGNELSRCRAGLKRIGG